MNYIALQDPNYIVTAVLSGGRVVIEPIDRMPDAELRAAIHARFRSIWRSHFRQRHHQRADQLQSWREARAKTRFYLDILEARSERGSIVDVVV